MLPAIDITFSNGALGQVAPSADGCFGVITTADEVSTTFQHRVPYVVKSMQDVTKLGIIDTVGNHRLFKFLKEFFEEGGSGQELWLMAFPKDNGATPTAVPTMISSLFDTTSGNAPAQLLLDASKGKLNGLFVLWNPATNYTPIVTHGIDADVYLTASKAQTFAEDYTSTHKAPFFVVLEGYAFNGTHTALNDLTTYDYNRVSILIGDTETRTGTTASKGTAIGTLAGRLAKIPVQENIGRVASGPVAPINLFIVDAPVESYDVESLNDKGFITFRSHVGRSGYFFTDDPQATLIGDDYRHLTHRRVIDKAYRIVYSALLNFLLDDIQLTSRGSISPIYAKTMEGQVISALYNQMTVNGELSIDESVPADKGVVVKVDTTNNVASTSTIIPTVQVRPKGHARYVDVPLGFVPIN